MSSLNRAASERFNAIKKSNPGMTTNQALVASGAGSMVDLNNQLYNTGVSSVDVPPYMPQPPMRPPMGPPMGPPNSGSNYLGSDMGPPNSGSNYLGSDDPTPMQRMAQQQEKPKNGAVYNRSLFKSAQTRPARNKLEKMAGIGGLGLEPMSRGTSLSQGPPPQGPPPPGLGGPPPQGPPPPGLGGPPPQGPPPPGMGGMPPMGNGLPPPPMSPPPMAFGPPPGFDFQGRPMSPPPMAFGPPPSMGPPPMSPPPMSPPPMGPPRRIGNDPRNASYVYPEGQLQPERPMQSNMPEQYDPGLSLDPGYNPRTLRDFGEKPTYRDPAMYSGLSSYDMLDPEINSYDPEGFALGGLVAGGRALIPAAGRELAKRAPNALPAVKSAAKNAVDVLQQPGVMMKGVKMAVGASGIPMMFQELYDLYGEERVDNTMDELEEAAEDGPERLADLSLEKSGVESTPDNKREFARYVLGEDINNIDEINQRIYDVAVASSLGKGSDAYAQAVLGGLGAMKRTAEMRGAVAASGSGVRDSMSREDMVISLITQMNQPDTEGNMPDFATIEKSAQEMADRIIAGDSSSGPKPTHKFNPETNKVELV